jgi:hypothetical protein
MAADEPSQEVAPVVKSPKAPVKRVVSTRGSKRMKRSTDTCAFLDTHRSMSSSDDVRIDPGIFCCAPCVNFLLMSFFWTELDEEVCHFGH